MLALSFTTLVADLLADSDGSSSISCFQFGVVDGCSATWPAAPGRLAEATWRRGRWGGRARAGRRIGAFSATALAFLGFAGALPLATNEIERHARSRTCPSIGIGRPTTTRRWFIAISGQPSPESLAVARRAGGGDRGRSAPPRYLAESLFKGDVEASIYAIDAAIALVRRSPISASSAASRASVRSTIARPSPAAAATIRRRRRRSRLAPLRRKDQRTAPADGPNRAEPR